MSIAGLVFMLAFFAGLTLAFVRNPMFGMYVYIADFYLHPPSRWWGATLPDLRWSLLAALATAAAIVIRNPPSRERDSWHATTPARIMIVFIAWFWLTGVWALDFNRHFEAAVLVTKYIVVFWMVYRLVDTPQKVSAFLGAHLLGCLYLAWLAYSMRHTSGRLDGVGGPGINDSNTLGMHLATGAVVASMLLLHWRGWRLLFLIVTLALTLNAVVLTGSRGAFVALVAGAVTLAHLRPASKRRLFYGLAVLGIVAFGYVASTQFWSRLRTATAVSAVGQTEEVEDSAESRVHMFWAQLEMSRQNLLGTGHRGSEMLSHKYLDPRFLFRASEESVGSRSSHNAAMTVLVEQGVPGALLMAWMVFWVFTSLRKLKRRTVEHDNVLHAVHNGAIGGALMVVFIGGMFADFSKCEVQIWMFALLAAMLQPSMHGAAPSDAAAGDALPVPPGERPAAARALRTSQ